MMTISHDEIRGWTSSPNTRGTTDILWSSLTTIYLCTWTSLCLNFPQPGTRGWRFLLYKLRWQLVTIIFPEVVVAIAAEQWLSAQQSVRAFSAIGHPEWTRRHGFFADMGGIRVAPPDIEPFPVDSQQLAYLVRHKYLPMPQISTDDLCAADKADGFARLITLVQMTWFCLNCIGRGITHVGLSPLELTALAFILCTLHNYFFWFHKPLDPLRPEVLPMNTPIAYVCCNAGTKSPYTFTPLDFIKPPPDPKSLISGFWFGMGVVFNFKKEISPKPIQTLRPAQTITNTTPIPAEGIGWVMMIYLLFFQVIYYGLQISVGWTIGFPSKLDWYLWMVSNFAEFGLITIYVVALALGTYFAPWIGRTIFQREASSVLEVASMLPAWAKLLVHAPWLFAYIAARALVLIESFISLRALPAALYQNVQWSDCLPHI